MLDDIGTPDRARSWVRRRLDEGHRISGFGHAVYRTTDPRSVMLAELAESLGGPYFELARDVEAIVLEELAVRHPERPLATNVEFWASVLLEASGVPRELFTSTFSVARVIGWSAAHPRAGGRLQDHPSVGPLHRPRAAGARTGVTSHPDARTVAAELWAALGGDPDALDAVTFDGRSYVLASVFPVTEAATAAVAVATLAVAALDDDAGPVTVDSHHACAAVRGERFLRIGEGTPPALWDPVAGDYPTADGWIRLHTNYPHHRRAALGVLDAPEDRDAVATAVGTWQGDGLESAIVAAGGCAAVMRSVEEWHVHPHARHVSESPVIAIEPVGPAGTPVDAGLAGLRILDLTRVIAGPTASRFLAGWGAEVLRVEAPGFREAKTLVVETGFGKRSCPLDLQSPDDRCRFEALVAGADVVVHGFRPGALDGLGYSTAALVALQPNLVVASECAYGTVGPWSVRRGFDSLVQMSAGIADAGMRSSGADHPVPLPCQLLDHAIGLFLAAGIAMARRRQCERGGAYAVSASLARTAWWLESLGRADIASPGGEDDDVSRWCDTTQTPWGPVRHVRQPGSIGTRRPAYLRPPSRPGADAPIWPGASRPEGTNSAPSAD